MQDQKEEPKYWFNLATKKVEFGLKSAAVHRIGPFETEAEASNALRLIEDRSKAWQQEEDEA